MHNVIVRSVCPRPLAAALVCFVWSGSGAPPVAGQPPNETTVISAARILTGRGQVLENRDLVVRDGRIAAIVPLGVGEGVDYGIYLFSCFIAQRRKGLSFAESMDATMTQVGSAVVFTGLTLSVGVGTWAFSALQFQADMGILLMFMFLMNMVFAILLLPAIARLLYRS